MSATIVRLMLSFIAVAASPAVYMAMFIFFYWSFGQRNDEVTLVWSNVLTGTALAAIWIAIWWAEVRWTGRRVALTVAVATVSLIPAFLLGLLFGMQVQDEIGILAGGITWALCWLTGSTLAWRETADERGERLQVMGIRAVACPKCGYNMTGLKQSVCPECGASYTIDQLFAALTELKGALPEEARR